MADDAVLININNERALVEQFDAVGALEEIKKTLHVTNIVMTANLTVRNINLVELARKCPAAHFSKHTFAAVTTRLHSPKATCLLYERGVVVCMGTRTPAQALKACLKYVLFLQNFGVDCDIQGFKVYNYVSSVLTFPVDLAKMHAQWNFMVDFNRKNFPGATIRCAHMHMDPPTGITLEVFKSGKINITGATSMEETMRAFVRIYWEILVHVRVSTTRRVDVDDDEAVELDYDADPEAYIRVLRNTDFGSGDINTRVGNITGDAVSRSAVDDIARMYEDILLSDEKRCAADRANDNEPVHAVDGDSYDGMDEDLCDDDDDGDDGVLADAIARLQANIQD